MSAPTNPYPADRKLRAAKFPCWTCETALAVDANYPPVMALPRTLELWCPNCQVTSLIYPEGWMKREVAA